MALRINSNIASIVARGHLDLISTRLQTSYAKLSTGLRVVTAADDAAGLAISERMRAQVRSLTQAQRNANDGISLAQTTEGALNEVSNILVRMRELAVEANNDTTSDADKSSLNTEFTSLVSEVDRIAKSTSFNGKNVLDGSTLSVTFQVGAGTASSDRVSLSLTSALASDLGLSTLDISTAGSPTSAITAIDTAIDTVSTSRGNLGAVQNRLQTTINNLGVSIENLSAAESRIRDVDVAAETAELTRNNILQQAAISVLAQANLQPQVALTLLRG